MKKFRNIEDVKNSFDSIDYPFYTSFPEGDYSEFDFKGILLAGACFEENCLLPLDNNLFQIIAGKSLSGTILPAGDFSLMNFKSVNISGCRFTDNSSLPSERDLFKKIKGKTIQQTVLPSQDYSNFDFIGVNVKATDFGKKSLLPLDKNFLRCVYAASFSYVKFPPLDYRIYNYIGVNFSYAMFRDGSVLWDDNNMFFNNPTLAKARLPKDTIENINYYNFNENILKELFMFNSFSIEDRYIMLYLVNGIKKNA